MKKNFTYSQQDANIAAEEIKSIFFASLLLGEGQARNLTNGQEIDKEVVHELLHALEAGNSLSKLLSKTG